MPNRARKLLTLVEQPAGADFVADESDESLAFAPGQKILLEWFRTRPDTGSLTDPMPLGYSSPGQSLPFCIRLTMDQVLNVAEEIDLRAQMLHWSTEEVPSSPQVLRKVRSLHEAAIALRMIAAFLKDGWDEPKRSS